MSRSKKKTQGGSASVRAWVDYLRGGDAPEELSAAKAAMQLVSGASDEIPAVSGDLASALTTVLGEANAWDTLARCIDRGSRDLAKEARRALHAARRRGAEVPRLRKAEPAAAGSSTKRDTQQDARALMTAPFADGDQVLVLRFRGQDRQLYAGVAMVSDRTGLRDLQLYRSGAKLYRTLTAETQDKLSAAEVPFARALHVLERAASLSQQHGRLPAQPYHTARQLLGTSWNASAVHPAASLEPSAVPDDATLYALWETPELRTWLPDTPLLDELSHGVSEVLASTILINDQQRLTQLEELLSKLLAKLFDPEGSARWGNRLEDAAWVASQNRRPREAGHLLAVRAELEGAEDPVQLPFCRQLLGRTLVGRIPPQLSPDLVPGAPAVDAPSPLAIESVDPEAQTPGGVIWTPGSDRNPSPGSRGGGLIVPGR
ncbi:MAG: hypothetical protein ABI333_23275 [bacterium]